MKDKKTRKDSQEEVSEPIDIKFESDENTNVTTDQEADAHAEVAEQTGPTPEEQIADLNDRHLRLAAEFDNYKKRTAREWVERVNSANSELLFELLEINDNFERALAVEHPDSAYAEGVKLIFQQLQSLLEKNGVAAIPALGEPFDPELHDALLHMDSSDYAEGLVCQEIRRGYKLRDRVLRHAQVAVSKGAADTETNESENNEKE